MIVHTTQNPKPQNLTNPEDNTIPARTLSNRMIRLGHGGCEDASVNDMLVQHEDLHSSSSSQERSTALGVCDHRAEEAGTGKPLQPNLSMNLGFSARPCRKSKEEGWA